MPKNPAYDLVLSGVGLILARANQLEQGARAWSVRLEHNPVSATTEMSAKWGGIGQQAEMPLAWDDLSGGYGSWNDRVERKYHWGYGVDCRFPKMVISGPLVTTLTLGGTVPVHDFEEHEGKLWIAAGRYVKCIIPGAGAPEIHEHYLDAGSGKAVTDIEEWKGTLYAGQGFSSGDYILKHTAGDAENTWTEDTDVQRGYLWPLWEKMYGTDSAYSVKSVATDPFTSEDWSASYSIGDTHMAITALATLEDELYIGKEDGVYGLDTSGIGTQLSPELRQYRCTINCKGMKVWHGALIVPHLRGLLQYASRGDGTHTVIPIGPGRGAVGDNPIRGHVTAICGDEKYLYAALWTGAFDATTGGTTYILAGSIDQELGDWAWHPLIKFADNKRCDALYISGLWTNPTLWMGYGTDVAYVKLPRGMDNPLLDSNCTYALTGTLRYQRHDLNAPASYKVWKCVEIEADNLSPERYITVYTRTDNGAWVNWGNAYQSPHTKILFGENGLAGKTIELRLDFTLPSSETPIILRSCVLRAAERPDLIETFEAVVRCDDNVALRNGSRATRTGAQTWEALRAMLNHNGAIAMIDPLGIERQVLVISPLEQSEARSEGHTAPEMLATVHMVGWDEDEVNMHLAEFGLGYGAIGWELTVADGWKMEDAPAEDYGWNMGATDADSTLSLTYAGTASSYPTITITGQISGVQIVLAHAGGSSQTLSSAFNIAAGEIYTIDCATKTVTNKSGGTVSVTVNDFFLTPGLNSLRLTGTNISADTACRIAWRTENVIA